MKKTLLIMHLIVLTGASVVVGGCSHTQFASARDAVDTSVRLFDTAVHVHDVVKQIRGLRDTFQRFERLR